MPKTPLFSRVRRLLRQSLREQNLTPQTTGTGLTRRQLLRRSAAGATVAYLGALGVGCGGGGGTARVASTARGTPRVAIVGGGLAGLLCAWRLQGVGIASTVYEAAGRAGGRVLTLRDHFGAGSAIELGGEFIDSEHAVMRHLAEELGEPLDDRNELTAGLQAERWWFGDQLVDDAEIVRLFTPVAARMAADAAREDDEAAFAAIDAQSITTWLEANGSDPLLTTILYTAYTAEYGLAASEQSAWNLLWLIDHETPDPFRVFGDSDERFHCRNGNDALITALATRLGETVRLDHRLAAVRAEGGAYALDFVGADARTNTVTADYVIMTLPFTILRDIPLAVELSEDKRRVIAELGYGTNAKVIGAFAEPVWRTQHQASGTFFADSGVQECWDSSVGQRLDGATLTHFVGGSTGLRMGEIDPETWMSDLLPTVDAVFPGASAAYRPGKAVRMHWPSAPLMRGSYACYRVGQGAFSGLEGERAGNLLFAGEHTSIDFQGYLEGAAESGLRAANELLVDLGQPEIPAPAPI